MEGQERGGPARPGSSAGRAFGVGRWPAQDLGRFTQPGPWTLTSS